MPKSAKQRYSIDHLSLQIISSLISDPQKSISQIAEEIGTSRTTVRKRIKKLSEDDWIRLQMSLNNNKAHLQHGIMFFTLANAMDIGLLFERLENCPKVITALIHVGSYHAIAFLVADTSDNLLYTAECLQSKIKVRDINFIKLPANSILFPKYTILRNFPKTELAPCGLDCLECLRYIKKQCDGCPASSRYRNLTSILNLGRFISNDPPDQK